jgi:hypothetical protein
MTTNFDPSQWIIDNSFSAPTPEGFYCPQARGFGSWSMWTIKKIPLNISSIIVRFQVQNPIDAKIPNVIFSYGEYVPNFAPVNIYKVSIFDGNQKIIRVYNSKNKAYTSQSLKALPDISSDMVLTLYPNPSHTSSQLSLDFQLDYKDETGAIQSYRPIIPLVIPLENHVDTSDGSIQEQFGVGIQNDACVKITSSNVQ